MKKLFTKNIAKTEEMRIEDFKTITEKHVEICKKLVESEGSCEGILCKDCPFHYKNTSNNQDCVENQYVSIELGCYEKDLVTEQSAKAFIKMCEDKKLFDFEDEAPASSMLANSDNVNNPSHYKLDGLNIESIDVIKSILGAEGFKAFCYGNALKYLTRANKKNGIEDFKKAQVYLKWYIEEVER